MGSNARTLVLQHHFGIGRFEVVDHTEGTVNRAGQFGVSCQLEGGLCHGYDRVSVKVLGNRPV